MQAASGWYSLLAGFRNHGGDWLARWLPAGFENQSLLVACWGSRDHMGSIGKQVHCHYISLKDTGTTTLGLSSGLMMTLFSPKIGKFLHIFFY